MKVASVIAVLAILAGSVAQTSAVPKSGVMKLWSKVGSFVLEGEGAVEITFTGTLLVSKHSGPPVIITGKVRKEFNDFGRQAWFGSGKAVIKGSWRRLQWFGKNMNAVWRGRGMAMVFGEYDAKQDTGFTQVDDQPAYPWLTTGRAFYVPKQLTPGYDASKDKPNPKVGTAPKPVKIG